MRMRLPDCDPPRRDDNIIRASSHPEILIREIAMRRRIHIPQASGDRQVMRTWSKWMLVIYALVAAAIVGYSLINPGTATVARQASDNGGAAQEVATAERRASRPQFRMRPQSPQIC
jgi:hypothetical protein